MTRTSAPNSKCFATLIFQAVLLHTALLRLFLVLSLMSCGFGSKFEGVESEQVASARLENRVSELQVGLRAKVVGYSWVDQPTWWTSDAICPCGFIILFTSSGGSIMANTIFYRQTLVSSPSFHFPFPCMFSHLLLAIFLFLQNAKSRPRATPPLK
jgi:hypothetical protein